VYAVVQGSRGKQTWTQNKEKFSVNLCPLLEVFKRPSPGSRQKFGLDNENEVPLGATRKKMF
jgi:hypothetical protein